MQDFTLRRAYLPRNEYRIGGSCLSVAQRGGSWRFLRYTLGAETEAVEKWHRENRDLFEMRFPRRKDALDYLVAWLAGDALPQIRGPLPRSRLRRRCDGSYHAIVAGRDVYVRPLRKQPGTWAVSYPYDTSVAPFRSLWAVRGFLAMLEYRWDRKT